MNIRRTPGGHPHEDAFEEYVFDRLSLDELAHFEEHLLICEECQDTLEQAAEHIKFMKAATADYAAEPRGISAPRRYFHSDGLRRNAATAAVLLLMCLTALLSWRTPIADPKTIMLESYRGGGVSTLLQAPYGRPLDLKIDLTDLPAAAAYRVEVVNATGQRVWFGGTPARLSKGLSPGVYWIRLFTDTGELLREFGLRAG